VHVFFRSVSPRVDFPIIAAKKVTFADSETQPRHSGYAAPSRRVFARYGRGGGEAEGEGVEDVGEQDGGESVVEVC